MTDQLQHSGTGFSGGGGDRGANEGFVVELVCVAGIQLEDAMLAYGLITFGLGPSRIGMQAGE
jgi:hypothetical protein